MNGKKIFAVVLLFLLACAFISMVVSLIKGVFTVFIAAGTLLILLCIAGWVFSKTVNKKNETENEE